MVSTTQASSVRLSLFSIQFFFTRLFYPSRKRQAAFGLLNTLKQFAKTYLFSSGIITLIFHGTYHHAIVKVRTNTIIS